MALTKQQTKALALDKNISVTAGAGSGKTKILVERFLKIALQDPSDTRRILAITFTKKAAGEMAERVASDLNRQIQESDDAIERTHLLEIRDQLSLASISTIHGFCSRILREFPIEAGLAPDFSEMDAFQQSLTLQKSIELAFTQIDDSDGLKFQPLFQILPKTVVRKLLMQTLKAPYEMQQIRKHFEQIDTDSYLSGLERDWLNLVRQNVLSSDSYNSTLGLVRQIILLDTQPNKAKNGTITLSWLRGLDLCTAYSKAAVNDFKSILEAVEFFTGSNHNALKTAKNFGGAGSWNEQCRELLVELSDTFAGIALRVKQNKPGIPDRESDLLWLEILQHYLKLYDFVEHKYNEQKQEKGWIDFDDLQLLTLGLLKNDESICKKLNNRFRYLMVDEFQDTNALQWKIISMLTQNRPDKIFVVGDPKQSIYGFRDADIRIFKQVKELFSAATKDPDESGNIVFEESFRFLPRLNAFINFIFAHILTENDENPFEVDYQPLNAMRQVPETGWANLALLDEEPGEEEYIARQIARLKQEQIPVYMWDNQEQQRPIQYGDIAILLRGRGNLLDIEQSLNRYGIPYQTVKGIGYWQKQEIYDFYHLLSFLNNPLDDLALLGVLRSTLILLSDTLLYRINNCAGSTFFFKMQRAVLSSDSFVPDESEILKSAFGQLRKWLDLRDRISLSALMQTVMDDLKLSALYAAQPNGDQLLANIEKLMTHAQNLEVTGTGGLATFVHYLEQFIEEDLREGEAQIVMEDTASVKIMTIHASKGLQFPIVFLPFLNTNTERTRNEILIESDGLAVAPKKYKQESSLLFTLLAHRKKQKELAEAKRLFYVGLTRASNRVFLSATLKKDEIKTDSALEWLDTVFDGFAEEQLLGDGFKLNLIEMPDPPDSAETDYQGVLASLDDLKQKLENLSEASSSKIILLNDLKPGDAGRIFSPTRIMTFRRDKQEYYQKYHLGFFDDDYQAFAADVRQDDYSLLRGKIAHRFLELLASTEQDTEALIGKLLFEFEVYDPDLRERFKGELVMLASQIKESSTGQEIIYAPLAQNEVTITMRLGDDYLTGTLDRIYQNADGEWQVVDYKTNRIKASQVEQESVVYTDQIEAYALLLSKIFPDQKIYRVQLYFLHPDILFNKSFSKEDLENIEQGLLEVIQQIKTEFPIS